MINEVGEKAGSLYNYAHHMDSLVLDENGKGEAENETLCSLPQQRPFHDVSYFASNKNRQKCSSIFVQHRIPIFASSMPCSRWDCRTGLQPDRISPALGHAIERPDQGQVSGSRCHRLCYRRSKAAMVKSSYAACMDVEGTGKCAVFGWNKRTSPLNAALLDGSFIQGFELDDVHVDAPWRANSIILPALFAAAEYAQGLDAGLMVQRSSSPPS
ncbi:hypothetical protein HO173_013366 [Letharia columbiana]|uniref:MmgE/PrpD N-terminal domain-containing protein n=1 Tax=Letharia columbiana TaxID=112416 RepID=A0A8H6CFN6_9LECA|nr:uncharacterized protein HO173_013366 [Letharia columbiana]KAF6222533.1 hypothetical protein HO173_013366 [Letharia columbiana]